MKNYVRLLSVSALFFVVIGVSGVYADQNVKIGVIQRLDNPDMTLMRESFLDEMQKKGYTVEVTVFNADVVSYPDTYLQRAAEEAQKMETTGMQLIYAIGGTSFGVFEANVAIPVVEATLFSPELVKLAVVKDDGKMYCLTNATGVLYGYPFNDIMTFIQAALPNAQKVAYLHNPQSVVSRPLEEIAAAASQIGLEVVGYPFLTKDEAMAAIRQAVAHTEIAFATNDIDLAGKEVLEFADANNYPLIASIIFLLEEKGILATMHYDLERAARICAAKADQIFQGTSANTIPLEFPDRSEIELNLKTAEKLGIEIPYEWIEVATKVIQ